jgi:hypothetical protein
VPDADLMQRLYDAALVLCNASVDGFVDGADIAREAGENPDDAAVYHAMRELEHRGRLDCHRSWRGGMGLPSMVRLP